MLVEVVELRCRGVKRAREDVLAAEPVRVLLSLSPGRPGWHSGSRNPPLMAGVVRPGLSEWAMPPLDQARVTTIKSGSLLVVGLQEVRAGRNCESFRQAWWCRVVGGASSSGDHRNSTDRTTRNRAFGEKVKW